MHVAIRGANGYGRQVTRRRTIGLPSGGVRLQEEHYE